MTDAPVFTATYTFRFPSVEDAVAVAGSLDVERADRIPGVTAAVAREGERLVLRLSAADPGDLRAATKSYWTRVQAAARVLEATQADGPPKE